MPTINNRSLKKMIEENNWDELEVEMKSWLSSRNETDRKIDQLLLLGEIYAKMRVEAAKKYLNDLNGTLEALKKLNSSKQIIDEAKKVKKLKNKIKDI